ncbi:hypothetical protein F5883DRAFT_564348 [Diaporthe sp. PMI_573]|nr:hypothetical protein F5883DRAFT_564348 [Diaporthaceae sp. PMI_573]
MELRPNHQFDPFGPDAAAYDVDDIDLDGINFNDPASFMKALGGGGPGGLPIPKLMQPDEVRREAKGRSSRLYASHSDLRAILERHEAVIQKRWIKKTKSQRQAILLKAWPNMATVHRPDFEAFKKESRSGRDVRLVGTQYRDSFIWPYINQEDLSKPKALPLLLNTRGRHEPCDFAAADGEAMHLGVVTTAIVPIFLNQHVMVLNGAVGPAEYGNLIAWDDHPDAFDWMSSRRQFLPGEGLLILEAQERLLGFLVSCCKQILHEIPDQTLTSDAFPIKPPPQLKTEADTSGFDSLAIMAAEAPYRVPQHLDLGRIKSLLAARESAAEDHMWSLREDPGYFAATQRELMEHRQELIKDTYGKPHPVLDKSRNHIFWARIVGNCLAEAYIQLEIFSELRRQAQELRVLQEKYAPVVSPVKPLPEDYLQAILKFRHYLNQAAKGPLGQLKQCAIASPPLRRLFVRDPPVDPLSSKLVIRSKSGIKKDKIETELLWLLTTLWEDGKPLFFAGMPLVVDELERLLDSEQEAKDLVSPYIAGVIGELSIISQCLTQLGLYQPWANGFEFVMSEHKDELEKEFANKTTQLAGIYSAIQEKNLGRAVELGNLAGGRFAYPIEKRRTKENVETLRQSEANLDAFWASIDKLLHAKAGNLRGTAVQRLLSQPRIIQRTTEWVEPIKEPKKAQAVPTTDQDVESLYKPLSALYFGLGTSKPDGPDGTLTKAKAKTRGTAKAPPAHNPLEDPNPSDPQPTIPVDARALKVFRTLFYNPSPTATPGEVSWNDFLHALTSTGFAAEKLYGSVWQFRPAALDVDRSIQFHEPHPRGKIPYQVARRHGRRLNRAYGWFGGMFTLKEK